MWASLADRTMARAVTASLERRITRKLALQRPRPAALGLPDQAAADDGLGEIDPASMTSDTRR
jgi:hypothetical protein